MKPIFACLPVLFASLLGGASAMAADGLVKTDGILVNSAGMTVYTFDKDVANSGKSVCNGACLTAWPAVAAPQDVKPPYSVVTRDDGSKQLAYHGKPLYLFVQDQKAGDRNGDNAKQLWHVVSD
ncbi:COG4315 family predicted lipoprotein [Janthinobacterium agaricidamnosum]|uniref:Lipoprotein n=1 Tax=Janthinobacterium agaricidamnosum NBRC 102515 = DSM 9628 TaxID=1349767 RepID=W0V9A2_9BURK|nr:lipoprotein [Janthinobacterium agaricidamnosum]CDG85409.1 secreted repeat of unknown function family protein [Janthinobacterium agaricidamnosum NBRC 102515 = DSM 9628]